MNIQIFGTKKCNDTKKAERFFKERGIKFQFIDMKEKGMSKGEFNSVAQANGGLENMINWEGKDKDLLALIKYIAEEDKLEKVLENPQVLLDLQRRYVEAGSHIVYASTFTGNRIKLEEYGLQERLEEINTQLVALSRQAVGDQALVAGDMTMTGQQLFPMGELLFEELVDVYKEQASVLAKAGVDLFVVETMMSLQLSLIHI